MPNPYFHFKQFTVYQDRCAMKVCTDACLFGAWVANRIEAGAIKTLTILDIGTGTGLLTLMLAQKTSATIDAIELDENAAAQASENFAGSPWKEKLHIIKADARIVTLNKKYDFIISNPPFFEDDLQSKNEKRNLALHSKEMSLQDLILVIANQLDEKGKFAVLLPYHRKTEWEEIAHAQKLYAEEMVLVRQTAKHNYFRVMYLFSKKKSILKESEISIREDDEYTIVFTDLLKEYYLKL